MAKKVGASHQAQLNRLSRIEGQVRGLSKMVEERRYCMDILTQIKAVKSALSAVEQNIVEQHLNHCVQKAIAEKKQSEAQVILEEIKDLLRKTMK